MAGAEVEPPGSALQDRSVCTIAQLLNPIVTASSLPGCIFVTYSLHFPPGRNMKTLSTTLIYALTGWAVQAASLQSQHLAVLRAGDGLVDLKLRQAPVFIDEFAPGSLNQAPISSIAIPTNGANTLFLNGHAATEGILARSADHHLLTIAGYGGV